MIRTFSVTNHKSIKDKTEISFMVGRKIKPMNIYGANSSGKSNLVQHIYTTLRSISKNDICEHYNPHRGNNDLSEFEVTFEIGRKVYKYGASFDDTKVSKEYLFLVTRKSQTQIFFREDNIECHQIFRKYVNQTGKSDLFISVCPKTTHRSINEIIDYIDKMVYFKGSRIDYSDMGFLSEISYDMCRSIVTMVNMCDTSISHLNLVDMFDNEDDFELLCEIRGKYHIFNKFASNGTKKMLRMSIPIIKSIISGGLCIIDDFGQNFHPILTSYITELFNELNMNGSQLIITSTSECQSKGCGLTQRLLN